MGPKRLNFKLASFNIKRILIQPHATVKVNNTLQIFLILAEALHIVNRCIIRKKAVIKVKIL